MKKMFGVIILCSSTLAFAQSTESELISNVIAVQEQMQEQSVQEKTQKIIDAEIEQMINNADLNKTNEIKINVYGGPTGGVIYFNVPLDYKEWQLNTGEANPEYARGAQGMHYGMTLDSKKFGKLDVMQVHQNNAEYDPNTCNGQQKYHQTITNIKYDSPNFTMKDWGQVEWGLKGSASFLLNSNKYLEDHNNTGIKTATPVNDRLMIISPMAYIKGNYSLIKGDKMVWNVNGDVALSPMTGMIGTRKQDGQKIGQDTFFGPQYEFSAGTLIKFKDRDGNDRVAIAVNFRNVKNIPIGAGEIDYHDRTIEGKLTYKIAKDFRVNVYAQNNQRMVKRGGDINTQYFEVFNNFGAGIAYTLNYKKKKRPTVVN